MRLPETKIKQAIVHPEKMVREEALQYFADCYSRDVDVMPAAIEAIKTYGRSKAFLGCYDLVKLAQTEATIEWAIRELHQEEDKAEDHRSYFPAISRLLCGANPKLTAPRAEEIRQAPGFSKDLVSEFRECLRLASWDGEQCWKELERICAEGVAQPDDVDFDHARRVEEALARQGQEYEDRILDLLGQEVKDFETDPMSWREIFLVMLAGEMRLARAAPLVVKKLHEHEAEGLWEECVEALGKIGTDAAAEAVSEGWLQSEWDYRLYAGGALEKIHSDTSVQKCLELLPQEKDLSIRTYLADALLGQFAEEGIEPVRELVQRRPYDERTTDLMQRLVAVSTVMGATFPEYPIWKREVEKRQARLERRMKEMQPLLDTLTKPAQPPKDAPAQERDDLREPKLPPIFRTKKQVGRNDPCPCGSGKKFKKCCLKKDKG